MADARHTPDALDGQRFAAAWQGESEPGGTYGVWIVVERVSPQGCITLPERYATREAAQDAARGFNAKGVPCD